MNVLEETMLSFELSAIDLILAVAVIVLLILYLTKSSAKPAVEEKLLVEKESPSETPATEVATPDEEREEPVSAQPQPKPQPKTGPATCPFGFGYLRKLDKDASIPDGCLGCSRLLECYSAGE